MLPLPPGNPSPPSDPASHLPGFLRGAIVEVRSVAGWIASKVDPDHAVAPAPADARGRAMAAMWSLDRYEAVRGASDQLIEQAGNWWQPAAAWSQGQALAGALDVAALTGSRALADRLEKGLSLFRYGDGYAPGAYGGARYYDDNAWIALDFLQAYRQTGKAGDLNAAERVFRFLDQPGARGPQGGEHWVERSGPKSVNTCSTAPAIEVALRLYQATKNEKYLDFAKDRDAALQKLLQRPDGLYGDNLNDDGHLDPTAYTYNQGTPIGADVLFYQVTGDPTYLDRAKRTAAAALDYFAQTEPGAPGDRFWTSAPAFNAIFFRNLLMLDAVAPDPRYRQALQGYLDKAWKDGRDPGTGLYTRGGIGTYDAGHPGNSLDQGAMAQMFALLAMTPEQLSKVT